LRLARTIRIDVAQFSECSAAAPLGAGTGHCLAYAAIVILRAGNRRVHVALRTVITLLALVFLDDFVAANFGFARFAATVVIGIIAVIALLPGIHRVVSAQGTYAVFARGAARAA